MSHQSIDDQELFALAARLVTARATTEGWRRDVTTVDLLKVRQEGDGLVVILVTGQKYRFEPGQIAAAIQNQLDNLAQGIDSVVRAQLDQPAEAPTRRTARKK